MRYTNDPIGIYQSLSRGLVGAWCPSVSGSFGFRLPDLSGRRNAGTLTNMDPGTDWVPSGGKLALDFDGSNDLVIFNQLSLGTTHTTAAWVYLRFPVAFDFHGICGDGTNNTCSLAASGNGVSITNIAYSWSATGVSVTVPDFIGRWTHIATARIGDRVEFFYNGNSYGSVSGASIPSFNCNRIGQRNGTVFTNGIIDDIRIYNRALTPSEIRLLYTGGRGVGLMPEIQPIRNRSRAIVTTPTRNRSSRYLTFPG